MFYKIFVFTFVSLFAVGSSNAQFPDLSDLTKPETSFLKSGLEVRKKQLDDLNAALKEFIINKSNAEKSVEGRLVQVNNSIVEVENQLKRARKDESETLNNKRSKLYERKEVFGKIREFWTGAEEFYNEHIKLVEEIIEDLKAKKILMEKKLVYSLEDAQNVQSKISDLLTKIHTERSAKDSLSKQKKSVEEYLVTLEKEIEAIEGDRKGLLPKSGEAPDSTLKDQAELLDLSLSLLRDRKEYQEINKLKLDVELNAKGDEIWLLERQREEWRKIYKDVQNRLIIEDRDVKAAKKEFDKQKQLSLEKIKKLNKQKEDKSQEQRRLKAELENLATSKKEINEQGKDDTSQGHLITANYRMLEEEFLRIKKDIDLLDANKSLEDIKVSLKEVQSKIVESRYKMGIEDIKASFEKWFADFNKIIKSESDDISALEAKRDEIRNFLTDLQRKIDDTSQEIDKIKKEKNTIFKDDSKDYSETIAFLNKAIIRLKETTSIGQREDLVISKTIGYKKNIIAEGKFIIKELETKREFDIWKRSPKAVTVSDLQKSLVSAEDFIKVFFWKLPESSSPLAALAVLKQFNLYDYLGLFLIILLFLALFFGLRLALVFLDQKLVTIIPSCTKGIFCFVLNVFNSFIKIVSSHYKLFVCWLFIQLDILINFKQFFGRFGDFIWYVDSDYLVAFFYVTSMGILLYLSREFIVKLVELNKDLGFVFFSEGLEENYTSLLKAFLYTTVIILPFKSAFLLLSPHAPQLANILSASYIIIMEGILVSLVLIHKDYILGVFRVKTPLGVWLKEALSANYIPSILFLFALLVLSNPYIGYFNLSYHLLFAIPLSALLIYSLSYVHSVFRKHTANWFFTDEDGDYIDKFDYAKTYYGISIILSFLFLAGLGFLLLAKIWGVPAAWDFAIDLIQDRWTLEIEAGKRVGFVQFVQFTIFVTVGFLISSFIDRFVLTKTFDILRLDFGVRNALSSIIHYIIIYLAVLSGFYSINLASLIFWVNGIAVIGLGISAKDLLADLIAGFLILIERPIEIGSFIEIKEKDIMGTVYKISPRSTTIRTALHRMIIIPNREVINNGITSWTYSRTYVGFDVDILISYDADFHKVKGIASKIVEEDHRILRNPSPVYRLEEFEENGYSLRVRCFISARRAREKWDISSDMRYKLICMFKENGVEIPYPQCSVYIKGELRPFLKQSVVARKKADKK
ncbi:mechanosensitive ion channel [Candidatus Babeliales bacterium]|nr:mechanosensitive ion channel [Candidatus Babeliales bacterium]